MIEPAPIEELRAAVLVLTTTLNIMAGNLDKETGAATMAAALHDTYTSRGVHPAEAITAMSVVALRALSLAAEQIGENAATLLEQLATESSTAG